jgi:hypothetical protein
MYGLKTLKVTKHLLVDITITHKAQPQHFSVQTVQWQNLTRTLCLTFILEPSRRRNFVFIHDIRMWKVVPTLFCTNSAVSIATRLRVWRSEFESRQVVPHDGPKGPKHVADNNVYQLTVNTFCWAYISYFTVHGKCGEHFHTWLAFGLDRHLTVMRAVSRAVTEFIRASTLAKTCQRKECPIRNGERNAFQKHMWKDLIYVLVEKEKIKREQKTGNVRIT